MNVVKSYIYILYTYLYVCVHTIHDIYHSIYPGSPKTKLCPLVGSGILYMDHPKDHSLFGLGLPGYINVYIYNYIYIRQIPGVCPELVDALIVNVTPQQTTGVARILIYIHLPTH